MKKTPTVSKLKKKLWTLFSRYIRQRDADENGVVICVSCGKRKLWKEVDAGHYIDGRGNAYVYNEDCVFAQCKPCNGSFINQKFDPKDIKKRFREELVKRIGEKRVKAVEALKKKTKQFTVPDLEEQIEIYKKKLKKYE